MKTSPFKIQGGVSPLKQNIPVDPMAGEGSVDPMVGDKKQSEINYSDKGSKSFENIAQFAPVTGEIIDAKNAIKDLVNEDYGGAALNMAGFFLPFIPGGVLKEGGKNIMNYLKKMPGVDGFLKSGKKMTKQQKMDFEKGFGDGLQAKGGVSSSSKGEFMVGGNKVKFDTSHKNLNYDIKGGINAAEDITKITNAKGVDLDDFVSKIDGPTDYSKSITKLPSKGTRDFVKVDLPNRESQIFYKSSGAGGKAGSKGEWIPFEGHRKSDGWYIKTGSRGKFHGKNISTIWTYKDGAGNVISKSDWVKRGSNQSLVETTGVYEQVKKLGLDPWKEIQKGNLKLDHYGQGFKYGSKEYVKIAEQLKKMNL